MKKRKLRKYVHWKRRGNSLVMASTEGEVCGKGRQERRKTGWITNVIQWRGSIHKAHKLVLNRSAYGPRRGL